MKNLAIVTTHPIQYYAPLFKLLSSDHRFNIKVFYTWGEGSIVKHDPGFGKTISWDIPLLEGYEFEFLENNASSPGTHHFKGIDNPKGIFKINSFSPDCILVFGWSNHSHLKIIRHFAGKLPVWFRGDSTLLDDRMNIRQLVKYYYLKWVYAHIDKAFYVGEQNKLYFQKYGLTASQLVFCPHSVDNERFSTNKTLKANKLREKLCVREKDILILFAGKLERKKNPDLLLNAVSTLDRPDVHLLFVGNGELEDKLKFQAQQLANNWPKRPKIHFMDFQNQGNMPAIYQACNLFCLPSSGPGETWGLAVNEAMAAGRAILVSTKVGCGVDLVRPGENGLIFEAGNDTDLQSKLKEILDITTLSKMGSKSSHLIQEWSLSTSSTSIISQLEKLN